VRQAEWHCFKRIFWWGRLAEATVCPLLTISQKVLDGRFKELDNPYSLGIWGLLPNGRLGEATPPLVMAENILKLVLFETRLRYRIKPY